LQAVLVADELNAQSNRHQAKFKCFELAESQAKDSNKPGGNARDSHVLGERQSSQVGIQEYRNPWKCGEPGNPEPPGGDEKSDAQKAPDSNCDRIVQI
jgi:hypothetical protein